MAARLSVPAETVLVDERLDPDRLMLDGVDTSEHPQFTVGDVAEFFFNRTAHWIRWLEREKKITLDGEPVANSRSKRGARFYTLTDVEKLAHALAQNRAINAQQLRYALMLVRIQAEMHGYL